MWLRRFLDIEEEIENLPSEMKSNILETIKKKKLTPLEFTILEHIFKYPKGIHGLDLIADLNKHFAGAWNAKSGTVYPILSKLKKEGFLQSKDVKSPIGPLKKVYSLTEAGKTIIKTKVNIIFIEQIKFMENFLIELLHIYMESIPEQEREETTNKIYDLIECVCDNIFETLLQGESYKKSCNNCNTETHRRGSVYCSHCGYTF